MSIYKIKKNMLVLFTFLLFPNVFNCYADDPVKKEWVRKELSKDFQEHLCALSNVYGYVRYFYPNDNLKDLDWFNFLIYSIKEIEPCKSEKDFEKKLYELFSPLCPDIQINNAKPKPSYHSSGPFYIQEHWLDGKDVKSVDDVKFINKTKKIKEYSPEYPKPDSLYTFNVNSKLTVTFPIALSELPVMNEILTALINSNKNVWNERTIYYLFAEEPSARIANEIIRCNIVQHFYPYYFEDGLNVTWERAYKDYFNKIANSENSTNYYYLVCKMMNLVKDSHVNLTFHFLRAFPTRRIPGIDTAILDNQLFVKGVSAIYEKAIHSGDRIIKINNNEAEALIKEKLKYLSYSTWKSGLIKLTSSHDIFTSYTKDSTLNLTLQSPEGKESIIPIRINSYQPFALINNDFIKVIDDNIYYVNLKNPRLTNYDKFKICIPNINKSKGVIFDMRGYPNESVLSILANITDTILSFGNLNEVHYYFPNHIRPILKPIEKQFIAPSTSTISEEYSKKYEYPLPSRDKIAVPCVFLINADSMSFMESVVDIIKNYKLGILVGENTAGCNGDAGYFDLPFTSFTMSFYKFLNRDGTQHHGVGIKPDICVENTDINKDSQLEIAKKYLNEVASHN